MRGRSGYGTRDSGALKSEFRDQLLGKAAARAFGEQRVFAEQLHATGVGILVRTILGDAHVAGRDAAHRALLIVEDFRSGETRIDLDAERFRLRRHLMCAIRRSARAMRAGLLLVAS